MGLCLLLCHIGMIAGVFVFVGSFLQVIASVGCLLIAYVGIEAALWAPRGSGVMTPSILWMT